jgi:hypothetical protein
MKLSIIISTSKINRRKIQYICKMTVSGIQGLKWHQHTHKRSHFRVGSRAVTPKRSSQMDTSECSTTDHTRQPWHHLLILLIKIFGEKFANRRKIWVVFSFFLPFIGQKNVFFAWRNTPFYKSSRGDGKERHQYGIKKSSQEKLNISHISMGCSFLYQSQQFTGALGFQQTWIISLYSIHLLWDLKQVI